MKVDLNIPIAENPNVLYVRDEVEAIKALKRDIVTAPGVLREGNIYAVFVRTDLCCDRNPTLDFLLNFSNVQLVGAHRCDCTEPDYTPNEFIYTHARGETKGDLTELFCRKIPFVQNEFVEPEMTLAEIIEAKVRREAEATVKLECNMDTYGDIIQQTRNRILEDYVAERIRELHKRFE